MRMSVPISRSVICDQRGCGTSGSTLNEREILGFYHDPSKNGAYITDLASNLLVDPKLGCRYSPAKAMEFAIPKRENRLS
jgi:hypothetical protein